MPFPRLISRQDDDNNSNNRKRCHKYSTIIGAWLMLLPNGLFWYWGNMSVYCKSYLVVVLNSTSGVHSSWVFSINVVFWTICVTISNAVSKRIGRRLTILMGVAMFNLGIFCSYFSVQISLGALTTTMGAVAGIGTGFMDGSALQMVIEWTEDKVGLSSAVMQGSFSMGALVMNQIPTLYLNPENLSPDFQYGPAKFFTQKKLLDHVPSMFLVVGCFSVSVHLLGFLLLRPKSASEHSCPDSNDADVEMPGKQSTGTTECLNGASSPTLPNLLTKNEITDKVEGEKAAVIPAVGTESIDFTYKEMLRTRTFYLLWFSFFMFGMPVILISSHVKLFGELWIHDDHFMAGLTTALCVASASMSAAWGIVLDSFGVKTCQVSSFVLMSLVLFWFYFTPMVNKWLFFIVAFVFMGVEGSLFSSFTAAIVVLYGRTHLSTNWGLLMTSQLCFHAVGPLFVGRIIRHFGWFVTYVATGAVLAISLLPILIFFPDV